MKKEIYQIRVELDEAKPPIWRKLLVPSTLSLSDLHKIIQTAMGWTNSHLHQFIKDGVTYVDTSYDMDFGMSDDEDYKDVKISDLIKNEKDKFYYIYDFGDNWEHKITLQKILPVDKNKKYPVCVSGKRNTPPEDCGGIWGYESMLKALADPEDDDHEMYTEWLGGDFDSEYFNKKELNEMLQSDDYGCITFY